MSINLEYHFISFEYSILVKFWTVRVALELIAFVQITGNSLTLYALNRYCQITMANTFITSLAVADLISGINSIFCYIQDYGRHLC